MFDVFEGGVPMFRLRTSAEGLRILDSVYCTAAECAQYEAEGYERVAEVHVNTSPGYEQSRREFFSRIASHHPVQA